MSTLNKLGQLFSKKALSLTAGVAVGGMMLGLGAFAESASAVTIGGYVIDDAAYADTLLEIEGNYDAFYGTTQTVLIDRNVNSSLISRYPDEDAFVRLGFLNNPVINGIGDDIALFELGTTDIFKIMINGITKFYQTRFTGDITQTTPTRNINVATINLDDFGIASGGFINEIFIGMGEASRSGSTPDLALVVSLNTKSVPEPSAMFGLLATVGFLACQRRFKISTRA